MHHLCSIDYLETQYFGPFDDKLTSKWSKWLYDFSQQEFDVDNEFWNVYEPILKWGTEVWCADNLNTAHTSRVCPAADLQSRPLNQEFRIFTSDPTKTKKRKHSNKWATQQTTWKRTRRGSDVVLGLVLMEKSQTNEINDCGETPGGGANMLSFIYVCFLLPQSANFLIVYAPFHMVKSVVTFGMPSSLRGSPCWCLAILIINVSRGLTRTSPSLMND